MAERSLSRRLWGFLPVYRRELMQYIQSPGTYVALGFFFILSGAFFLLIVGDFVETSRKVAQGTPLPETEVALNVTLRVVGQLFSALNFLMLLVIPILTMRLLAEEKRSGSFELLVTTPLSDLEILVGKYLAVLTVGLAILLVCTVYPAILAIYSAPEAPVVLTCYLGLFLIIAAYSAFGLFASSLTDSQISAAVLSFVGLLIFQMAHFLFKSGAPGRVAAALSIYHHSDPFTKGIVALPDVAYFLLFAVFFLFLTGQVLDARRWRV
ncbi:ABC transporter permease [bacterium]|nr:ABC transporter permease [bacterium]